MSNSIMLGFDFLYWQKQGIKIPVHTSLYFHYIVVGSSGSGKSTAVLYWLYKARKHKVDLYIADFKASREFSGITPHFAEFEGCYDLIKAFYQEFQNTPEGGDGTIKIMLVDEIAGLLTHFGMTKEGKSKADEFSCSDDLGSASCGFLCRDIRQVSFRVHQAVQITFM